jgi:hypothetical protein
VLIRASRRLSFVAHNVGRYVYGIVEFHREAQALARTRAYAVQHGKTLAKRAFALLKSKAEACELAPYISADVGSDARPLVAILVNGGIGDCIVIARFLRDLATAVEEFRFDIYCRDPYVAEWVFKPLSGFNKAYHEFLFFRLFARYPLSMRAHQLLDLCESDAKWDVFETQGRLLGACNEILRHQILLREWISEHPYRDNELCKKLMSKGFRRENVLHGIAGVCYGGPAFPLPMSQNAVAKHGLPERYVTINNGVDSDYFVITGSMATKCYPHFDKLVRLFKGRYPDVPVVQIGSKGSRPIAGVDTNLVERTTLAEAATIVGQALLHIDSEGGLVHIAACLGTTSVVIFGPTSADYFAYPDNINLRPPVCGNCWWTTKNWMDICPLGHKQPPCMYEQTPLAIMDAIAQHWIPQQEKAGGTLRATMTARLAPAVLSLHHQPPVARRHYPDS